MMKNDRVFFVVDADGKVRNKLYRSQAPASAAAKNLSRYNGGGTCSVVSVALDWEYGTRDVKMFKAGYEVLEGPDV